MLGAMGDAGLNQPVSIPAPRRTWTDDEWHRLRGGRYDGEWDASVVGDRLLLAEGESGQCIYAARFRRELSGWRVMAAEVESDPSVYEPGDPAKESEALQAAIERLVR